MWPETEPYDDEHITTKLAALESKIEHLVKRQYFENRKKTNWNEYNSVQEPDDRDFKPTSQLR